MENIKSFKKLDFYVLIHSIRCTVKWKEVFPTVYSEDSFHRWNVQMYKHSFHQLPLGWPETGYSTEGRCPSIPYCPSRFWNPLHVVNSMGLTNVLSLVKQALQMRRVSLGSATISRSVNINVPMDNKCLVVDLRSSLETKDLVICFAQSYPLYLHRCSFLLSGPNLLFGRLQHPES